MKKILLIPILFLFVACVPRYKIVKEYYPPKESSSLDSCKLKEQSCQDRCKANFDRCKIKADKEAEKLYKQKMKEYVNELEVYANLVDRYNFDREFDYYDPFFYGSRYCMVDPFFRRPLWHEPMFYLPNRPVKPSLEQEKLKSESKMCQLDCGCHDLYDECFLSFGGVIKNKKICIKNCPNE